MMGGENDGDHQDRARRSEEDSRPAHAGVLILETFLPQLRELIEMKCMHAARDAGMAEPFERMIEQIERAGVMLDAERASVESAKAAFLETYGSAESQ